MKNIIIDKNKFYLFYVQLQFYNKKVKLINKNTKSNPLLLFT